MPLLALFEALVIGTEPDTGAGVAAQDVGRPLFTTKSDGMGTGLSVCRSIIEANDGRLSVSENTTRGAMFQLVLPSDAAPSTAASEAVRTGSWRSLLITT